MLAVVAPQTMQGQALAKSECSVWLDELPSRGKTGGAKLTLCNACMRKSGDSNRGSRSMTRTLWRGSNAPAIKHRYFRRLYSMFSRCELRLPLFAYYPDIVIMALGYTGRERLHLSERLSIDILDVCILLFHAVNCDAQSVSTMQE